MAHLSTLKTELRERAGKGAARATRRTGRIPAVIYGNKQTPVMISLDSLELAKELKNAGFFSRVFELDVSGEKHRVLPRDLQLHPVTDRPIHVDFMRFSAKTRLNIEVPVIFENEEEAPGIKSGGVLNIVRHSVELRCSPDHIPESLIVDLTGLDVGDSVHISSIELPGDVELTITDRDFTIATIAAPTVNVEVEAVEDEDEVVAEGDAEEGTAKE